MLPETKDWDSQMISGTGHSPEELLGRLNEVEKRHAPAILYTAGDIGLLHAGPRVSIVGSRRASDAGLELAARLVSVLVEQGVVVVSGLAEGVDTMAHVTAIAKGGSTIAVLGTPLSREFPATNRTLQHLIMKDHLAVSQFAEGKATGRASFPMRNRTMALLSHATIIVEAGEKSGTKHQGWEALRLGRRLFFTEHLVGSGRPSWVAEMEEYGAEVISESVAAEIAYELPDPGVNIESALAG